MGVPYTFGTATTSIPLSQLDANFNTPVTLGNTTVGLGNTVTTVGNLTLTNVTITSGTINAAVVDSGYVANSVVYANSTGVLTAGSADFVFDGTNVGIGTSSPNALLTIAAASTDTRIRLVGRSADGTSAIRYYSSDNATQYGFLSFGNAYAEFNYNGSGYMGFATNNTERMRITSGGNVGIGNSSPNNTLSIQAGTASVRLDSSTGTNAVYSQFVNTGGSFYVGRDNSTGAVFGAAYASVLFSEGAYPMNFYTAGTERMRIDSSGNVGIGTTTTSTYKVNIANNGGNQIRLYATDVSTTTTNTIDFWYLDAGGSPYNNTSIRSLSTANAGNGNLAFYTTPTSGSLTERMRIDSSGFVAIGNTVAGTIDGQNGSGNLVVGSGSGNEGITVYTATTGNGALCFADGTSAGDTYRGYIQYEHSNNALAFGTNAAERMRIDSTGTLLMGATSASGWALDTGGVAVKTSIAGNQCFTGWNAATSGTRYLAYFGTGSSFTNVGAITTNGTSTSYVTSSDYRLKENIAPMTGALAKVSTLKPVTYTWKVDGSDGQGFIAHELAEVVPQAVTGEKDAVNEDGSIKPQGVDYGKITPLLTAALQEALAKIESLEARLATLESK